MCHTLTKMCQTFSFAPSKEQNLIDTPKRPWPPHKVLGVMKTSRIVWLLLEYTVMDISFSMLAFSKCFKVSLSWLSLVFPMATTKSKKASNPATSHAQLQSSGKINEGVTGLNGCNISTFMFVVVILSEPISRILIFIMLEPTNI